MRLGHYAFNQLCNYAIRRLGNHAFMNRQARIDEIMRLCNYAFTKKRVYEIMQMRL